MRFRLVVDVGGTRAISASSDGGGGDRSESDSSFRPSIAARSDVDFEDVSACPVMSGSGPVTLIALLRSERREDRAVISRAVSRDIFEERIEPAHS